MLKTSKFLSLVLFLTLLVGCSSSQGNTNQITEDDTSSSATESTSISMLTGVWGQPPVDINNSQIYQKLEEETNTDLDIQLVPVSNYDQNLSLVFTSNELPDLIHAFSSKSPVLIDAIKQGAFHNLGEFNLEQYENLNAIPEYIWRNSSINGEFYGVPNSVGMNSLAISLRQDWLEALDLEMPTTLEELKDVLIAFRENDPDGNGKKDTFGIAGAGAVPSFEHALVGAFGVHEPVFEGEYLLLNWMKDSYKDYLEYLRDLYENEVLPTEYYLMGNSDVDEMVEQGLVGGISGPIHGAGEKTMLLQKQHPEASFAVVPPIQGPNGYTGSIQPGYYGMWLISSAVDEEKVPKILEFLDQTATKDINNLINYGIEGIHYDSLDDTIVERSEEQEKLLNDESGQGAIVTVNVFEPYNDVTKNRFPEELESALIEKIDAYQEVSPTDPFSNLISDTFANRASDVFANLDETRIKVATGVIGLDEWDDYVETMKNNPTVQQIMKEYAEQYKLVYED